jgi:hypothetical protein
MAQVAGTNRLLDPEPETEVTSEPETEVTPELEKKKRK